MVTFQTVTPRLAATVLFSTQANTGDALVAANQPSPEANTLLVEAMEKDIQRIQGFRTKLTPTQNQRLAEIRDELQALERTSQPQVKARREARRLELNTEAFKILGKKYVDIEGDPALKTIKNDIDALLEPVLRGEKKARLERLRNLESTALGDFLSRANAVTLKRLDNIERQIARLVPPRLIGELSLSERRDYDALVKKANDLAGTEAFLPAAKLLKIEKIQTSIARLS